MRKSLQILKNLLEVGILSPINRWIGLISIIFSLQGSFGYIPGSISGKYASDTIDTGFCYDAWMRNTMVNNYYGSEAAVRSSVVPSAMVDPDGVLYTITLYGMETGNYGAKFLIGKYTANGSSVSRTASTYFYPWSKITTINMQSTPYLGYGDYDPGYFNHRIHNCFQPSISQQVTSSGYIAIWFFIPPLRYAYASEDAEGIYYADFSKSSLSVADTRLYYDNHAAYYIHCAPFRRYNDSYTFDNELGNYQGWQYGSKVHLDFLATKEADTSRILRNWHQYNYSWSIRSSYKVIDAAIAEEGFPGSFLANRYILHNDYVYGIYSRFGYYLLLTKTKFDSGDVTIKAYLNPTIWVETFQNGATDSRYSYDFCMLEDNGDLFFCPTGLCAGGSYTALTSAYNWSSTYLSWTYTNTVLVLRSFKITEDDTFQSFEMCYHHDFPQNVIYETNLQRGNSTVACIERETSSTTDEKRLYLNTHKICTYKSAAGNQYLIYCYCYPGKTKQLYLGYARVYFVTGPDGARHAVLGTKCEFRETADQWSNSFSNFTSCARIISMDCKNGHLWITWMNADNDRYYHFHILAKDLVGE